jgi:hypothetical protein
MRHNGNDTHDVYVLQQHPTSDQDSL